MGPTNSDELSGSPIAPMQDPRPIVPKGRPKTARLKSTVESGATKRKPEVDDDGHVASTKKQRKQRACRVCKVPRASGGGECLRAFAGASSFDSSKTTSSPVAFAAVLSSRQEPSAGNTRTELESQFGRALFVPQIRRRTNGLDKQTAAETFFPREILDPDGTYDSDAMRARRAHKDTQAARRNALVGDSGQGMPAGAEGDGDSSEDSELPAL